MKDDKKLQRMLLRMITEAGYWADHDDLIIKAGIRRADPMRIRIGKQTHPSAVQIRHQFKLLEEKGAIRKTVTTPYIRYEITTLGHAWLKPWYQRLGESLGKQASSIVTAAITSIVILVLSEIVKRALHL
ncbi:MAG TPA: hypothetical protein VFT53_03555 [Candidatus Saccharimonadales bacterium]|nr:hypothetical protein [Candidatus Saccharimonadales bacterium]